MTSESFGANWGRLARSSLPAIQWLPQYKVELLRADVVAGVTLAAYAIPRRP
jgi:MFS superfamily sulfate permease-like transporter